MKKQIVAACVAALSFSATACNEQPKSSPKPKVEVSLTPPPAPVIQPVITSKVPTTAEPVSSTSFIVEPTAKDLDVLAVSHEDARNVDHLSRAVQMREIGDFTGALAEARRALFDSPDDVEVLTLIDRLTKLTNEKELRIATLERLAKLQPEDARPLVQQARVLISKKDYEGAIGIGAEAAKRDENNPEAYHAIGRAHLNLGQLAPAIAMFEKVIALEPEHGHALNNLGFAYLRANRNEEALTVLTRASELLPNVAWIHNNLGVALERVGRIDEAKDAYARSSFLSPKYVKAQLNVARVASVASTGGGTDVGNGITTEESADPQMEDEGALDTLAE
ncbi:MAG: tetratricopeptide repeat protein [Myxococcaceae bacterium]